MASSGYDVVVDVDADGDLGHTDLQEDSLEFHSSNFTETNPRSKAIPATTTGTSAQGSIRAVDSSGRSGFSSKKFLWSLSFYAQFFDVDTNEVFRRCQAALFPKANFLDVLDGNPDLYGPFWIATTVVVILFLTGTISRYLAQRGEGYSGYDFALLSGAAGLVYGYTAVIPLALWAVLKWSGSEAANALECLALYGYANLIWIPVALISWSNIDILNYVFVGIGFSISALFLFRNLWPVISTTPQQRAKILLLVIIMLHAGLAVAIKILFFAHNSPAAKEPSKPSSDTDQDNKPGKGQHGDSGNGNFMLGILN